MDIEFALVV